MFYFIMSQYTVLVSISIQALYDTNLFQLISFKLIQRHTLFRRSASFSSNLFRISYFSVIHFCNVLFERRSPAILFEIFVSNL